MSIPKRSQSEPRQANFRLVVILLCIIGLGLPSGCRHNDVAFETPPNVPLSATTYADPFYVDENTNSEFSDYSNGPIEAFGGAPLTSRNEMQTVDWPMTLDEAIHIALTDTQILRGLNANAVLSPETVGSKFDPQLQASNPNFGLDAAHAQFDPRVNSGINFAKNDDVFNNAVIGGGATEVRDDVTSFNYGITDFSRRGTQFSLNNSIVHSDSTIPSLLFPSSFTTILEASARHPLLQGSGFRFNELAGLTNTPGFTNTSGIVISRLNHDISVAQFETDLRQMISEIVNAYWTLERANRDYEAVAQATEAAEETWKIVKAEYDNELRGGEADREAQAREQMFDFRSQLLAAENGDARNGRNGLFQAEANLRRLLNLPQSDGRFIVPADHPVEAPIVYNWPELASIAVDNRVELVEQVARVTRRQLELEIAQNFLLPRLDAIATFRNNGFGSDLAFGGSGRFSSAADDAFSGDHNEWEVGLVYDQPIGFRQARSGVRNAQLAVCREKAILVEQRRQILHELGNSLRQLDQSFEEINLQNQRTEAAQNTLDARSAAYLADAVGFEDLLLAQQRLLLARLDHHRALIDYEIAREQMVIESGQLFREYGIVHNVSNEGF